ncbi:MAG: transposase [Phycisphaeraceae bacterium]|nr:transposase [Phycisphaeraceae bacterium]
MARPRRIDIAGYAYHVLNRAVARRKIFHQDADYAAFEEVLAESVQRSAGGVKLLAYCLMPNHWHLVIHPTRDGAIRPFMQWLTLTHTQRYRAAHNSVGDGPIYQGRYRSFIIEGEAYLCSACRYVERNAMRAGLTRAADAWPWCSLWRTTRGNADAQALLAPWPTASGRPRDWLKRVNQPETQQEIEALRIAARRGRPWGSADWTERMARRHNLASTLRPIGRPKSHPPAQP